MAFQLPKLPYAHDGLEPHLDAETMKLHHYKHHAAYVEKLNEAIRGTDFANQTLEGLFRIASKIPDAIRNNAGGHFNHTFFWSSMAPRAGGRPNGPIQEAILDSFGGFEAFQKAFDEAATKRFGSGWAWLIADEKGHLKVTSTPNQDNPLMDDADEPGAPLLALDVWEHAYYLKYQNRRPDYVSAWWNVVNWDEVNRRYRSAKEKSP